MWVRAMEDMGIQAMVESYMGDSLSAQVSLANLALTCRDLAGLHYSEVEVVVWEAPDESIFITDRQVMPFFPYVDLAHARFLWRLTFDTWFEYHHERQEEAWADLLARTAHWEDDGLDPDERIEEMLYMDAQGYPTNDWTNALPDYWVDSD